MIGHLYDGLTSGPQIFIVMLEAPIKMPFIIYLEQSSYTG